MSKFFGNLLHTGKVARVVISSIPEAEVKFIVEEDIQKDDLDRLMFFFQSMTDYTESSYEGIRWANFIEFESIHQLMECHKQSSAMVMDTFVMESMTYNVGLYRMVSVDDICIPVRINDSNQLVDIRDVDKLINDYDITAVWCGPNLATVNCVKKEIW